MADEPLIVKVIHRYHPDWEPPKDSGRDWIKTRCPFHGEGRASSSVSFKYNAFRCHACSVTGSAARIIKEQEEVSFAEAKRIAAELSEGSDGAVPRQPGRKSGRRVFTDEGSLPHQRQGNSVPPRVRGRPTPWA